MTAPPVQVPGTFTERAPRLGRYRWRGDGGCLRSQRYALLTVGCE